MPNQTAKSWFIDVPSETSQVLINAGCELSDFIARHLHSHVVQSGEGAVQRVILGTAGDPAIQALLGPKPLKSANGRRTRRIVRKSDGRIAIVGSDERAVLDGIFALEEWLLHGLLPATCDRTWSDLYATRRMLNYGGDPAQTRDHEYFRTVARQGYTHCAANMIKGAWDHSNLNRLVVPRGLPVAHDKDEVADFQRRTNAMIKLMQAWGIKPLFYVLEPTGPDAVGGGTNIPEEVTGRRYVPYQKKEIRTFCTQHPRVKQYYRMLIQDMIRAYPGLDMLCVYCDDGSFWFCDWTRCPRCGKQAGRLDYTIQHPMKIYLNFVNLLQEAGREINPAFSVSMWTLHLEDQIERDPKGFVDRLSSGVTIVHTPHYWDGFLYEKPSANEWRTWQGLSQAARKNGIQLVAADEYVNTESLHVVRTLPTVEGTARKLGEYSAHGVGGLWVEVPPVPGVYNPANLVWQLMVTGEITDPQKAAAETVRRTYGVKAAPVMQKALTALHAGLEALNKDELMIDLYVRFLLSASPWGHIKVPITPATIEAMIKNKNSLGPFGQLRPEILERAKAAEPYFERAIRYAEQGVKRTSGGQIPSSAVLDHPDLRDHSAGVMIRETQHALRLWAAVFKMWANRLQAAGLVRLLNGYNTFRPPFQPPYAQAYRKTADRLISLAKNDCVNLKLLAGLIEATPETREVLKFGAQANERLSTRAVAQDVRNTLALTQKFLKDPWPEIYKIKMERNYL